VPDLEISNSLIDTEVEHEENGEDNSDGLIYNVADMEAAIKANLPISIIQ